MNGRHSSVSLRLCSWCARGTDRLVRYLAIATAGTFVAYSIISYKTPWCLIVLIWPLFLFFGYGVIRLRTLLDRWATDSAAALLGALSLGRLPRAELPQIRGRSRALRVRADAA
jgi:hypothetical protein